MEAFFFFFLFDSSRTHWHGGGKHITRATFAARKLPSIGLLKDRKVCKVARGEYKDCIVQQIVRLKHLQRAAHISHNPHTTPMNPELPRRYAGGLHQKRRDYVGCMPTHIPFTEVRGPRQCFDFEACCWENMV